MAGRCRSCNAKMTDADMVRKHLETGEYFDLCFKCLKEVNDIINIPFSDSDFFDNNADNNAEVEYHDDDGNNGRDDNHD